MKFITVLVFTFFIFGFYQQSIENCNQKLVIIIEKCEDSRSKIYYSEKKDIIYSFRIKFDIPNHSAWVQHIPSRANHWEYSHEEIEIGQTELINAQIFFANQLSFSDWSDLEKLGEKQKIYVILYDEYMNRDRFVWNHKFKAWEVWVTADGPI